MKSKMVMLTVAMCAVAGFLPPAQAKSDYLESRATVYLTAKDGDQRLSEAGRLSFEPMLQPQEYQKTIFLDPGHRYQTFVGIGAALTDAAAETFYKLPEARRREFIRAHFDAGQGIGYTLGRTPIHSCDFSSASYTYVEDGDVALATFDIRPDLKYRVPFIQEVLAAAGGDFRLYASPWSPPAWMKSNNSMLQGGKLKPEFAAAWADYYVKFVRAYERQGIPIWGLTVQNEPMAKQRWESCIYTADEERDFVKNHLGPTLVEAGLGDLKLIVWDHNRDLIVHRVNTILSDPEAAQYVWGVGFHWYEGGLFDNVALVHNTHPQVNLIFTEACNYPFNFDKLDEWHWGENYARNMIEDFNAGAVGWTDWNILLDETGGPNHVQNFCYAPVHGDTRTGELHYMNSYYYIGHFSKFIRPGARRISSSSMSKTLATTAFVNPDGSIAAIVMNGSDESEPYYLWVDGVAAQTESPAHSIQTVILPPPARGLAGSGPETASARRD